MTDLPDFSPYNEPLDLPVSGPIQCGFCKCASVSHIALMAFGGGEPFVDFGCASCVRRWLHGPIRQVTFNGVSAEEWWRRYYERKGRADDPSGRRPSIAYSLHRA